MFGILCLHLYHLYSFSVWTYFIVIPLLFSSFRPALYGIIFYDNVDGAFSTYRLHESVGLVFGFVMINSSLCMQVTTSRASVD